MNQKNHSTKKHTALRGFTLVEVLIAAMIFTIVSLIAVNVFVNLVRIQRRITLENAIYEDARVMMERIARVIRENTVDYEEYYNKALTPEGKFATIPGLKNSQGNDVNPYGNRYGCYAQRFYNPGQAGKTYSNGSEDGGYGAFCTNGLAVGSGTSSCIIDKNTLDIHTGQNPYAGSSNGTADTANAFCDATFSPNAPTCTPGVNSFNVQDELYLINPTGTEKTLLASKVVNVMNGDKEHALALLRLTGEDFDQDSVVEQWRDCVNGNAFCCSQGFDCEDTAAYPLTTAANSLENTLEYNTLPGYLYKGFVPISPTRTNVQSLKFFVAPLEDPRKAFSETDVSEGIQQQPHVTIVLTVTPSKSALDGYPPGEAPAITIQTTVTSRVYNEVKSFHNKMPGAMDEICLKH